MKKLLYASLFSFSALFFAACDGGPNEDSFEPDTTSGWVQFETGGTTTRPIGTTEVSLPVELNAPVNTSGVDIAYTVTDVTGTMAGSVIADGIVTIPAGSLTGEITLGLPTNLTACAEVVVTLTSTNRGNVQVGLSDNSKPVTRSVRLVSNRDMFLGTYDVVEDDSFTYEVVITAGEAPNELVVANLYDVNPASQTSIFLNYANNSVEFPALLDNFLFQSSNPAQGNVYVDAEGASSFDPCAMTLDLNFVLVFGPTQGSATPAINTVLTKQ